MNAGKKMPKEMRNKILHHLHDSPISSGHFGVEKTLARIKQAFWWPPLETSVEKHIANCDGCAASSTAGIKRKAELQTFLSTEPLELWQQMFWDP